MHQILVIGATNRPQDLDPAIQRRFQRNLLIAHPDTAERLLIFKKLLTKVEKELSFSFDEVLYRTEGYCANDLLNVCQAAMLIPVIERKQFLQAERRRRRSSAEQQPIKPAAPNEETTAVVAAGDGNSCDDDDGDSQEEQQGPKIFGISLPLQWRRSISGRETVRSIPAARKNETQQPAASQPAYSIPPLRPLRVEVSCLFPVLLFLITSFLLLAHRTCSRPSPPLLPAPPSARATARADSEERALLLPSPRPLHLLIPSTRTDSPRSPQAILSTIPTTTEGEARPNQIEAEEKPCTAVTHSEEKGDRCE